MIALGRILEQSHGRGRIAARSGLPDGEVHVWITSLRADGAAANADILDKEERRRASRLRYVEDRNRYIAAHSFVRSVLAGYVGARPEELHFRYGPSGKPELFPVVGRPTVSFNVSHARRWAALAIARSFPVGVDVEEIDPALDVNAMARVALSESEQLASMELAPSERPGYFFATWTCKEAVLKAVGHGLSEGLKSVGAGLSALASLGDRNMHRLDIVVEHERPWRVRGLQLGHDCVGAVAAPDCGWILRCFPAETANDR